MTPELSIVVPVYNVGPFLRDCIDSILAQTYTDFELIIVDDGSTDDSGAICDSYAEKDGRVRVIHKENGGVVSARKAGISAARGTYAGYVDGDDRINPRMYAEMVGYMKKYGCDMVMCDIENERKARPFSVGQTDASIEGGHYDRRAIEEKILPQMMYTGEFYSFGIYPVIWNKLYKRDMLLRHQLRVDERIKIGEDAACVYPYLMESESFYFIKDMSLYLYRYSKTQMTEAYDSEYFERFKALYDFFASSGIAASPYAAQLDYYYAYMIKMTIGNELRLQSRERFSKKLRNVRAIADFAVSAGFLDKIDISALGMEHRLYYKLLKNKKILPLVSGVSFVRFIQRIFK